MSTRTEHARKIVLEGNVTLDALLSRLVGVPRDAKLDMQRTGTQQQVVTLEWMD